MFKNYETENFIDRNHVWDKDMEGKVIPVL
jgi:hypothetical protein